MSVIDLLRVCCVALLPVSAGAQAAEIVDRSSTMRAEWTAVVAWEGVEIGSAAAARLGTIGASRPEPAPSGLPDPFARRTSVLSLVLPVAILVFVAVGVWLLLRARREATESESDASAAGPQLAFDRARVTRRRAPEFYEDLRRREQALDGIESRAARHAPSKVIELPKATRDDGEVEE